MRLCISKTRTRAASGKTRDFTVKQNFNRWYTTVYIARGEYKYARLKPIPSKEAMQENC